jgi:Family of unknown function (DUF5678)
MNPEEVPAVNPAPAENSQGPPGQPHDPFADLPPQLNEEETEQYWDIQWALFDPELQELYPDKLVAVFRRRVIAVGDDRIALLKEAERITGLPGNRIAIVSILGPGTLFAGR